MEGGTDLDLQVLEVPSASAAAGGEAASCSVGAGGGAAAAAGGTGGGGGGGGEKTPGDPSSQSTQLVSETTGSRTEEATSRETVETKASVKVRRDVLLQITDEL